MAISIVQSKASSGTAAASKNVTLTATATAGNKLIVIAGLVDPTRTLLTPTNSGTWDAIDHTVGPSSGNTIFFWEKEAVGNETTITVATSDGVSDSYVFFVYEVAGLINGNAKDKTTNPSGVTGESKTAGTTATLTQANEIAFAMCMLNGTYSAAAWDNGFTLGEQAGGGFVGYKIVNATAALTTTATWTTSRASLAGMVTYKGENVSNQAPTANAGPDQTVTQGDLVTLNGTGSSDPDGTIASYAWTQTAGSTVSLSSSTVASPTFTAPDPAGTSEVLTFSLVVTDNNGTSSTANTVDITVNEAGVAGVPTYRWTGSAWATVSWKRWNGTAWV